MTKISFNQSSNLNPPCLLYIFYTTFIYIYKYIYIYVPMPVCFYKKIHYGLCIILMVLLNF